MATANIVTVEDLEAFKERLLQDISDILSQRKGAPVREWLKSSEVRRILMISPNTLQMLRVKGKLPFTKIGGVFYYAYKDIAKMLEENKTQPPDDLATLLDNGPAKARKRS
jgi:hypothetical protein